MIVTAFKNAGVLAFQVFDKFICRRDSWVPPPPRWRPGCSRPALAPRNWLPARPPPQIDFHQ